MKQFIENSLPIKKIDTQNEAPFDEAEKENGRVDQKSEKYRQEAQKFVDSHRRFFTTFAKDVSLTFKISNGFFIDLEKGEVNLNGQWFLEKDFSKEQILWGCLHELEHFRDLDADAKGVLKNFEYIRSQAKKTGVEILKKWEEKYGTSDLEFVENLKKQNPINPKKPEKGTMNATERVAYKIHHTFYNIFDDINDNNNVARKAPAFEEKAKGGQETRKLYQEKLFAKTDYSTLPRHLQFVYKLLREEMVKGEEVVLSNEVSEMMARKIMFQGKEYLPKEIVENFIKPKKNRNTLANQRYFVLRKTLEPIFEELLLKDLKDWDPQKSEKQDDQSQKGDDGGESNNPFKEEYQDYDKNNPDQISEEDIQNWMDKNKEDKENEEEKKAKVKADENKTAQEKAEEAQADMDKAWCEKNSVDFKVFQKFKKIEKEVESHLQELSRLWQRIIFGSNREIRREKKGYFKTGAEMSIQKVIEEWPKIQEKKFEDVRVMERITSKEVLVKRPEKINIRLVGDMSGSMDEKKRHILQQCAVLILLSLYEFNTQLNLTRSQTKSKLETDTEMWIFGDEAEKIKKLKKDSETLDEKLEIIKIFEKLNKTIGYTFDHKVMEEINKSLKENDRKKIKTGKIMELVFEITDGGSNIKIGNNISNSSSKMKSAMDNLLETGVIARGFQIGNISKEEKKIFNEVWNDGRKDKLGEIVGEKIENLIPAITEALKKYLSNVRL